MMLCSGSLPAGYRAREIDLEARPSPFPERSADRFRSLDHYRILQPGDPAMLRGYAREALILIMKEPATFARPA